MVCYRTASGTERDNDSSTKEFMVFKNTLPKLNAYPARYRSRFSIDPQIDAGTKVLSKALS
ncbi:MAG: hypothetical protein QOH41_1956 [Blastocatellia bacterium]|nr:hypothetical protein [Blastocatellia bacterium]